MNWSFLILAYVGANNGLKCIFVDPLVRFTLEYHVAWVPPHTLGRVIFQNWSSHELFSIRKISFFMLLLSGDVELELGAPELTIFHGNWSQSPRNYWIEPILDSYWSLSQYRLWLQLRAFNHRIASTLTSHHTPSSFFLTLKMTEAEVKISFLVESEPELDKSNFP